MNFPSFCGSTNFPNVQQIQLSLNPPITSTFAWSVTQWTLLQLPKVKDIKIGKYKRK